MSQISNVRVYNTISQDLVQQAPTADVTLANGDTGIIVNAPLTNQHGGPQAGPSPMANFYKIIGTDSTGREQAYAKLRYTNQTPDGNAQYTTQ